MFNQKHFEQLNAKIPLTKPDNPWLNTMRIKVYEYSLWKDRFVNGGQI